MAEVTHSTRQAIPSEAISAASSAKSAKGTSRKAMESEFRRNFELLNPESKRRFLQLVTWMVDDGRPETDPRNGDSWWAAYDLSRCAA